MSIFGDIADAVGDAGNWVAHAAGDAAGAVGDVVGVAEDVLKSGVAKTVLNFGGTLFGDPGLGSQIAGGLSVIDNIFGKGSSAGKTLTRSATPKTMGFGATIFAPARRPDVVQVMYRGRRATVSRSNLSRLAALLKKRSAGGGLLASPITLTAPPAPPPPPPPVTLAPGEIRAILTNPDAARDAAENGTPLTIGGRTIDPSIPISVPVGVRADVIALGFNVVDPSPRYVDDPGPGAGGSRDL